MTVKYTMESEMTGVVSTLEFECDREKFLLDLAKWRSGTDIDVAFHYLEPGEREFIVTGISPAEWINLMEHPDGH